MKTKKIVYVIMCVLVAAVMFSCATTGPAFEPVSAEQIPEGSSIIYLYRPKAFAGSAVKYSLTVNSVDNISLTNGGYYPYVCEPGEYTIVWKVGSKTPTTQITVEEGEEYYVKSWVKVIPLILVTIQEYHLEIMDTVTGQEEISVCKRVE